VPLPFRGPIRPLRRFVRIRTLALVLACAIETGSLVTAYALIPIGGKQPAPAVAAASLPGLRSHTPAQAGRDAPVVSPTPSPTATSTPATPPAAPAPPRPAPTPFPFEAGVNVLVYGNDPAFAAKAAAQLDHLAQLHVNSVAFVFPIYQASWTATTVYGDPNSTPTASNMRTFIRAAHQRHMRVLLRPLLDEGSLHAAGKWRGQLAPSSTNAWFASYTSLVMGYAKLAQAENVEIIDIGTELDSLQSSTQQWLNLISSLRGVYHGQLTYSANWAIWYPSFGWALDFLSVDAFFPLAVSVNGTQQQLAAAWGQWVARANGFGYSYGKHVVFTELGTTSEVGSFQQPWLWSHNTGLSLEAQRLYYAAACQALKGRIGGVYWWEYVLDPLTAPATDTTFDPQGKPADQEISRCYA
jgi:hypothetical protein